MTSSLLPIDSKQHLLHGWRRHDHYHFTAKDSWTQVVVAELPALLPMYALAFFPRTEGGYQLIAIQGLHAGENCYLDQSGRWLVGYVPSAYRGYPFTLREAILGEKRNLVLCFDLESGLYRETPDPGNGDVRFFDDSGLPNPLLKQLLNFFTATAKGHHQTNNAVDKLEQAQLLKPWSLSIDNPEPGKPLLKGLYRIDEVALNSLPSTELDILHKANALPVAYAQLFSMPRLKTLCHLYDLRQSSKPTQAPSLPANLDTIFGEKQENEAISFDWLSK